LPAFSSARKALIVVYGESRTDRLHLVTRRFAGAGLSRHPAVDVEVRVVGLRPPIRLLASREERLEAISYWMLG
jgi:hypothetical protein